MIAGSRICTNFKKGLLCGQHAFNRDWFALALYTAMAQLDPDVTGHYTPQGEVVAPGYEAGGQLLGVPQILSQAQICYVVFPDPVWRDSSIVARAALLYNRSQENLAVAILDFGADQYSNHGAFHVQFPPPGPVTSLIRIV